jgi:DNA-binding IclR family transcriptional regulator
MNGPTKQAERHVEAVLAGLDILDCFLKKPSMSIKQIMEETGFTRNRVMRLTGTLLHKGYLVLDSETGAFALGPEILALSRVFERNRGIVILARPILREIALTTGESASLYVREGLERVVLAREEGTQPIRYAVAEGQRMDLHAGAGGKVLLAFGPKDVLDVFLSSTPLIKRTTQTITDQDKLLGELKKIRKQGYATSTGERVADACALAAPVFDSEGDLVGALGIAGPISRFTSEIRKSYLELILDHSNKFSRQLGWKNNKLEGSTSGKK